MSVFTIADTHLALGEPDKSMEVFKGWENYVSRLEKNWRAVVEPEDTVVIAGDVSWAMKIKDLFADFSFIDSLPGEKLIVKGNHDLWWDTASKIGRFLEEHSLSTVKILHNNAENVLIFADGLNEITNPNMRKKIAKDILLLQGRKRCSFHCHPLNC